MKSVATRRFQKSYLNLSPDIQRIVDSKLEFLETNPSHLSLRVKKMQGKEGIWEASVTKNYRITFEIHKDKYLLRAVGTHDILLKNP